MTGNAEILAFIRDHKEDFEENYGITKIGLFGSFARAEETPTSDIDLIVEFKAGTQELFRIKHDLRQLFSERFHRNVDICREKYVKPYYKKQILKDVIFV